MTYYYGTEIAGKLVEWIETAKVVEYLKVKHRVLVATRGNKQLILTSEWVRYDYLDKEFPHFNVVLIENGTATLLYQVIVDDVYGQEKHSTGEIIREDVESLWAAMKTMAGPVLEEKIRRIITEHGN